MMRLAYLQTYLAQWLTGMLLSGQEAELSGPLEQPGYAVH
jgi:hypothetical protein